MPTDATIREVLGLLKRITDFESEFERVRVDAPPGTEDLMQGDDTFELSHSFYSREFGESRYACQRYEATVNPTWNEIFSGVSPVSINEASELQLRRAFSKHFAELAEQELQDNPALKEHHLEDFKFSDNEIDTCLVQLRASGHDSRKR